MGTMRGVLRGLDGAKSMDEDDRATKDDGRGVDGGTIEIRTDPDLSRIPPAVPCDSLVCPSLIAHCFQLRCWAPLCRA